MMELLMILLTCKRFWNTDSHRQHQYQFKEFKPETVASWELGYKGIIDEKLFIDIYGFYAQYTNFIGLTVLVKNPLPNGLTPPVINA